MSHLPALTLAEMLATDWSAILKSATDRTCSDYSDVLLKKAREATEVHAKRDADVFGFLGQICSLHLRSHDGEEPFISQASGTNWRTISISDLSTEDLDVLDQFVPSVTGNDPELLARVCDILWLRRKDHKRAQLAVDAYLESATILMNYERWPEPWHRIERATNLALQIRGSSRDIVHAYVVRALAASSTYLQPSHFWAKLLQLLRRFKDDADVSTSITIAEDCARTAETAKNWPMAREYYEQLTAWRTRGKDVAGARVASIQGIECFVNEATQSAERSSSVAATHLARAIDAYRRLGGHRERVDELHKNMLGYQQKSLAEMKQHSGTVDISAFVESARSAVRGKPFPDALIALARIVKPLSKGALRTEANKRATMFVFSSLFPSAILDRDGKVVARRGSLLAQEDDDAVVCQMYSIANEHRDMGVVAAINPARQEIIDAHYPSIDDIAFLVRNNPFIPPGREHIYLRGVHAGLQGDFVVALHLLVPQFEDSVRQLLKQTGAITSSIDADSMQADRDLNSLLYEKAAESLFGEDFLFDLRGLLIHRFGANLRNRMAHGLLSADECYSAPVVYLWWIVLQCLCVSYIQVRAAESGLDQAPSEGREPTSDSASTPANSMDPTADIDAQKGTTQDGA